MAQPKVLSSKDLKSGVLLRSGAGDKKKKKKKKKKDSSTRLSKTNIGKGKPSQFQNPDFSVPTIQLGLSNQNELQKTENKLSKTQKRLSTTSLGKTTKVTDALGKNIIPSDIFNNNDPFDNDGLNQAYPKFARDSVKHGTLKLEGMTNRSKSKAATRGELPTLSQMLKTDNFRNTRFNSKSRSRFLNPFNAGGGVFQDEDDSYKYKDNRVKITAPKSGTRVGNKLRKGAGTQLRKVAGGLDKLARGGIAVNTRIFTPSGQTRSQVATDKAFGNIARPDVTPIYSNFANPKFGLISKSVTRSPSFTQSQFSQNIKLLSAGKGLGDSKARAAIAAASASSSARLSKISKAKARSQSASMRSNPNLAEANRILAEQGANYRIIVRTRRRRRGRYTTYYAKVYHGPTIRSSRIYTSSRGRQRRIYSTKSTGDLMGTANPYGIVQAYYRNKAISEFGIQQGIGPNENESTAAHASRVTKIAQVKKDKLLQYIEPFDSTDQDVLYSYAAVGDDKIQELENYYGDLTKAHGDYDKNIQILSQGIAKVQTARGKASSVRKGTSVLGVYDTIESRETPFDSKIADTSAQLASIDNQLSQQKSLVQKRGALATDLNAIMGTSKAYSLDEASSTISDKITAQKARIEVAKENVAKANTPAAKAAARRSYQGLSRGRKRRYRSPASRASAALRSEQAHLNKLQSVQSRITQTGKETWGTDKINSGIIATPANRTVTGARTGRRNWYRGATGSTVLKIPKDKIPASGKVIVEATLSYFSGYKGRTHALTTFGTLHRGSKTFRKELPVDANGNVKISMHMYGTYYGQQAKGGISNIKVIDPTSTSRGATLFGNIADLSSQKSQLQSTLRENQATKSYFDNAQAFLGGKLNTLKGPKGKTIATYSRGKLNIQDQDRFVDVFGESLTDSSVFTSARKISVPIDKLRTRVAGLQSQRKSITDKDTLSELDMQIRRASAAQDFLTGKTNKLVLDAKGIDSAIVTVEKQTAKDVGAMSTALRKRIASQNRNKNSYGFRRYVRNKSAIYASWAKSKKAAQDAITKRKQQGAEKIAQLKAAKEGKSTVNVASRGQLGKIDVKYDSVFKDLGITIPKELLKQGPTALGTKKLDTLETSLKAKEAKQKALVVELKTVQKERIKENAVARTKQINELVRARVLNRREAAKQKADIAKQIQAQTKQIDAVSGNVPIPDITAIDSDLKSEAQRILDSTENVIKSTSKAKARQKLRQVARSRKPATSPVGAVLKVGAVVPRPRPAIKRQSTSLGTQSTSMPTNPFLR